MWCCSCQCSLVDLGCSQIEPSAHRSSLYKISPAQNKKLDVQRTKPKKFPLQSTISQNSLFSPPRKRTAAFALGSYIYGWAAALFLVQLGACPVLGLNVAGLEDSGAVSSFKAPERLLSLSSYKVPKFLCV